MKEATTMAQQQMKSRTCDFSSALGAHIKIRASRFYYNFYTHTHTGIHTRTHTLTEAYTDAH